MRFLWVQHPSFRIGDVFRLDIEGKLQEDGHSAYGPVNGLTPWEFHRNRFGIKGRVAKHIEYEVEHEFTEHELTEKDIEAGITPRSQWKDVNVNLTYFKHAQIQIGKFNVPFGLDELTGVTHNDYVYRSLAANYLDPGRDIGGMLHGRFFKKGLSYWVGAFNHDGDNAKSKKLEGGGKTFAARVSGAPFRRLSTSSVGNIEIGSAYTFSELSDDSFRPLVVRALKDPELRELWLSTILECADSIVKPPVSSATPPVQLSTLGWLEYEVGRMADQIRDANYADPSREVYTNADFDESIRFLTTWAQTRSDIVRAQVAADRASRGISRR